MSLNSLNSRHLGVVGLLFILSLAACSTSSEVSAPTATGTEAAIEGTDTPPPTKPKPTETESVEEATEAPSLPDSFSIDLVFEDEPVCGYDGFEFEYEFTIEGDMISLYQVAANITSTGPYAADTGEFSASVSGLPGTETFEGLLTIEAEISSGESVVTATGIYSYGDDPGVSCEGMWPFSGSTE